MDVVPTRPMQRLHVYLHDRNGSPQCMMILITRGSHIYYYKFQNVMRIAF